MKINLKSILNATWKVGVGLFGAGFALICVLYAIAFCQRHYGRAEWFDRTLSPDVVMRVYRNNTVRLWDKANGRYTTKKLRWVSGEPCAGDSLTVFCDLEGWRGFVNVRTGEIVIPAQYRKAWNFSEGIAAVLGEDNKVGFIDKDNQLVIDYIIPYQSGEDYVFKGGYCRAMHSEDQHDRCALYRKDGSLALEWNYIELEGSECGYRIVRDSTGCWLLDQNLRKVLPQAYDTMKFSGHNSVYATKNHIKQLIAYDGTVIEPFVIDGCTSTYYCIDDFEGDGYTIEEEKEIMVYFMDKRVGLMDAITGKIITPARYLSIRQISPELFLAKIGDLDGESVLLDRKGRVVGSEKTKMEELLRSHLGEDVEAACLVLKDVKTGAVRARIDLVRSGNGDFVDVPGAVSSLEYEAGRVAEPFAPAYGSKVTPMQLLDFYNTAAQTGTLEDSREGLLVGKNGTAHLWLEDSKSYTAKGKLHKYVSTFAGYFPAGAPKYSAVCVVVSKLSSGYPKCMAVPQKVVKELAEK